MPDVEIPGIELVELAIEWRPESEFFQIETSESMCYEIEMKKRKRLEAMSPTVVALETLRVNFRLSDNCLSVICNLLARGVCTDGELIYILYSIYVCIYASVYEYLSFNVLIYYIN